MSNQPGNEKASGKGCIEFLSLLVFLWGAAMMFPKTADLLSQFSPDNLMGYTGVAMYYGYGSALLIEGVLVIMKLKAWVSPADTLVEWMWDVVLTLAPFALSALAQVFDGMLVRDTLSTQPVEIQLAVTWGVPLLPAAMILLLSVYGLIQSAPSNMFGGVRVAAKKMQAPKIPSWFTEWISKKLNPPAAPMVLKATDTNVEALDTDPNAQGGGKN